MYRLRWVLGLVTLVLLGWNSPVFAQTGSLADQVRSLAHRAEEGVTVIDSGNVDAMREEYRELHYLWETFEVQVRTQDPAGYIELESTLVDISASLQATSPDPTALRTGYAKLQQTAIRVADRLDDTTAASLQPATVTPTDLLKTLDAAYDAIERGDTATATMQMNTAIGVWPSVEGVIAAKSPADYTMLERDFGIVAAALKAQPPDMEEAKASIKRMRETLIPYLAAATYTPLDAAAIILREGLEALLVLVALLAFLQRSGNTDKQMWIWAGAELGILASVASAFALQALFSRLIASQNQEIIEGATGLIAAALLFYVAYWMHSKASLHAWRAFIETRTAQALAGGNLMGLALLTFFAVFREGGETTVLYLGMVPAISVRDLILGLSIGVAILVVVALLMLFAGVRLPLRPFLRSAGLLVYYLGFKFVGAGIHALQVAGVVSTSPIPGLPAVPLFGIYPSWETTLAQCALLLAAVVAWAYLRARDQRAHMPVTAA